MFRLIAADMDDTLLGADSDIAPRTVHALHAAMDAGAQIVLASGRMTESMLPFAKCIGVNAPMIAYNGAMVCDYRDGRTLFADLIDAETARSVAKALESMGIYLQVYPGDGYYCRSICDLSEKYAQSIRVMPRETNAPLSEWIDVGLVKMLAIAPPEIIDPAHAMLQRQFPSGIHFMKSRPNYLEIVAEGIDKAATLKRLSQRLNVAPEEILAFGDGQNDAAMLAFAGCGAAMENACGECKREADLIAPRNTEHGVAQVVERLLAEGKIGRS